VEEDIVEERTYTIPLSRAWISPRKKRVPKAVRIVRAYIQRHMKIETGPKTGEEEEEERLVISNEVNERLWGRGIEKPPRNIRIRAVKDKEGTVTLYLAEGD
jgi:large subunit ribosomal protein L31e